MSVFSNGLYTRAKHVYHCFVIGMFISVFTPIQPVQAEVETSYSFGVIPQFDQIKITTVWKPIIEELSRRTGLQFHLVIPRSISEFEESLEKGDFDFVYANPYHILRVSESRGYIPLIRDKKPLRGILVVRRDSLVTSVKELAGKSLAVPSPNALGASLLLRSDLENLYGVHMSIVNEITHNAAYLSVIYKATDAAGGVKKTFNEQDKKIKDQLKILYTTRAMPSHPIAANHRVQSEVQLLVKKALLDMSKNSTSKLLLNGIPMESPVSASLNDYLTMRNLGLEKYWVSNIK